MTAQLYKSKTFILLHTQVGVVYRKMYVLSSYLYTYLDSIAIACIIFGYICKCYFMYVQLSGISNKQINIKVRITTIAVGVNFMSSQSSSPFSTHIIYNRESRVNHRFPHIFYVCTCGWLLVLEHCIILATCVLDSFEFIFVQLNSPYTQHIYTLTHNSCFLVSFCCTWCTGL